jgi:hypothetical protein
MYISIQDEEKSNVFSRGGFISLEFVTELTLGYTCVLSDTENINEISLTQYDVTCFI